MIARIAGLAALLLAAAAPAGAVDTFTIDVATDPFASVHLQVRVDAPNRAGYMQEGSAYKVSPDWQYMDSLLCGRTTRELEVWADPRAARAAGPSPRLTLDFVVLLNQQAIGQARVVRDISGGGSVRGFTHLADQDFLLVINRTCR